MPVQLRRAGPADIGDLLALEHRAFGHDRIARRSFRAFARSPRAALIAAAAGERLAGYALVLFRRNSAIARLYSIAVAPEASGQGIGRALLQAAEDAAKERGAARIRLEVDERNGRAARLYGLSGYRPIGRLERYYEDGAAALRMEKSLVG